MSNSSPPAKPGQGYVTSNGDGHRGSANGDGHYGNPTQQVIGALHAHGFGPRPTGSDSYESRCSGHNGSRLNLSIAEGQEGQALLCCHHEPPCSIEAIVAGIGLAVTDLFPAGQSKSGRGKGPKGSGRQGAKKTGKPKAEKERTVHPDFATAINRTAYAKGSTWQKAWEYRWRPEEIFAMVVRYDVPGEKKAFLPYSHVEGGVSCCDPPTPWPPYRYLEIRDEQVVHLFEGEKCADFAAKLGLKSFALAHGAKNPGMSDIACLAGKTVYDHPDNDEEGERFLNKFAGLAAKLSPPPVLKVVRLPGLEHKEDIVDWFEKRGGTEDWLKELIDRAEPYAPPPADKSAKPKPKPIELADIPEFANYEEFEVEVEGPKLPPGNEAAEGEAKTKKIKIPWTMAEIADQLSVLTPTWPKRINEDLFAEDGYGGPLYLNSPRRLIAWIERVARVAWMKGDKAIPQERFYEHLRMTIKPRYQSIETVPHFPEMPETYYMVPPLPRPDDHLDTLLGFFAFETIADCELAKAMVLTWFWGGKPGRRPVFMITGPESDPECGRGVGKSTLIQTLSRLIGGYVDVSPNEDIAAIKTRFLSNEDGRKRVAMIDNLKSWKFSWAELEGLVTSNIISGHAMYKGEGSRPNVMTWAITVNGGSFSKDLSQRIIPIRVARPAFDSGWQGKVESYIDEHRWQIIADVGRILNDESAMIETKTRWASWEHEVLSKTNLPLACQKLIADRRENLDVDSEDKVLVAGHFESKLIAYGHLPDEQSIMIPSQVARDWLNEVMGTKHITNAASGFIASLQIEHLTKLRTNTSRGWRWSKNPDFNDVPLNAPPLPPTLEERARLKILSASVSAY